QRGNNNPYCQDNEISWFDWRLVSRHADLHRFVRLLFSRRLLRDTGCESARVALNEFLKQSQMAWHGVTLFQPDWCEHSHSLAFQARLPHEQLSLHLLMNAFWQPLVFELPGLTEGVTWRRWIDTALPSPDDIVDWTEAPAICCGTYRAEARSVVTLIAATEANAH